MSGRSFYSKATKVTLNLTSETLKQSRPRANREAKRGPLIQTCQRNDINPWDYLTELQRNHEAVKATPGDWLPWTYKATLEVLRHQPPAAANPPPKTQGANAPIPA